MYRSRRGFWRQFLCRVGTRRQEVMQTLDKSCTTKHPLRSILDTILSTIQPEKFCHTHKADRVHKGRKKSPPKTSPVSVRARSHSWRKKRRGIGDQGHSTISAALTVRLLLCVLLATSTSLPLLSYLQQTPQFLASAFGEEEDRRSAAFKLAFRSFYVLEHVRTLYIYTRMCLAPLFFLFGNTRCSSGRRRSSYDGSERGRKNIKVALALLPFLSSSIRVCVCVCSSRIPFVVMAEEECQQLRQTIHPSSVFSSPIPEVSKHSPLLPTSIRQLLPPLS